MRGSTSAAAPSPRSTPAGFTSRLARLSAHFVHLKGAQGKRRACYRKSAGREPNQIDSRGENLCQRRDFFFFFFFSSPQRFLKGHEAFKELCNSHRESSASDRGWSQARRLGSSTRGAGRWQEGALRYSLSFELCRYIHPCSIHPEEGHRAEIEQSYVN